MAYNLGMDAVNLGSIDTNASFRRDGLTKMVQIAMLEDSLVSLEQLEERELGFSVVHGCEKAANDLNHLVDKFGEDIVLAGNMDVVFLSSASPQEVCRETEEMLKMGSSRGEFIAACNTSPLDYISEENYLSTIETTKSFDPSKYRRS